MPPLTPKEGPIASLYYPSSRGEGGGGSDGWGGGGEGADRLQNSGVSVIVHIYVDDDDCVVNAVLGLAELLISYLHGAMTPRTFVNRLRDYVEPTECLESPLFGYILIVKVLPIVLEEFKRVQEVLTMNSETEFSRRSINTRLRQIFSGVKYFAAEKLHVSPLEARFLPIEEIVDYMILAIEESDSIKRKIDKVKRGPSKNIVDVSFNPPARANSIKSLNRPRFNVPKVGVNW